MLANPLIFYLGVVALTFVIACYAHLQKIQSRLRVARGKVANGSKTELEDAEALLEKVIQKNVRLTDRQTRADAFNDLGVCQLLLKKSQNAVQSFRSSLDLRSRTNVQQYVATLENLGSGLHAAGDHHHAISTYREALAAVGTSEPYRKSSILSNLGVAYRDNKDFADAHRAFEDSLEIARAIGDDTKQLIALSNLARFNRDLGLLDETRHCSDQAIPFARSLNQPEVECGLEGKLSQAL